MTTHAEAIGRLLTAVLLSGCALAPARAAADLRGEVFLPGGTFVAPGEVAKVVLTVTNLGPVPSSRSPGMGTAFTPNVGFRNFAIIPLPDTAPCTVRYIDFVAPPGQLSSVGVGISTERDLAPSESASCVVGLLTYPESPSAQIVRFGFAPQVDDPDPSNNITETLIRTGVRPSVTRPTPIPASSLSTLLWLAGGMLAAGMLALRRAR